MKPLRILLALGTLFFLNIVVPVHQRGAMAAPGSQSAAEPDACPMCAAVHAHSCKPGDKPDAPVKYCAICAIAAHMSVPPVVDWTLPKLQLLHCIEARRVLSAPRPHLFTAFDGRAPPAFS